MTVRFARSDQTGMTWPTLSGTAGNLTTLLDALLVDGSSTVAVTSITRSGTTATVTTTVPHGIAATDPASARRVVVAGANEADYNGEYPITVTGASTFTYEVAGSPATPATGAITTKRPGAGFAIAYTGTSKRAYRAATGLRHYVRVIDDGTTSAAYGRAVGYESMTDVDTGVAPFPTAAQFSGGLWVHKSSTADATTRPWFFISNGVSFFLVTNFDSNATYNNAKGHFFGEIVSYKSGDAFHTGIIGGVSATASAANCLHQLATSLGGASGAHYIARQQNQTGASVQFCKFGGPAFMGVTNAGGSGIVYPSLAGRLYIHNINIGESSSNDIRGELPGCWNILHNRPVTNFDTWSDTWQGVERTFMQVNMGGGAVTAGSLAFEVSDTW